LTTAFTVLVSFWYLRRRLRCRQRVQERREQGAVGGLELNPLTVELALQHGDLVAQGEDLDVLVVIAAW